MPSAATLLGWRRWRAKSPQMPEQQHDPNHADPRRELRGRAGTRTGWISVPFHERHWHRSVQMARATVPILSIGQGLYAECAQSRGLENIGRKRTIQAAVASTPVQNHLRITLENNAKIQPQPDRENAFARASGGGDGSDVQPSPAQVSLHIRGYPWRSCPRFHFGASALHVVWAG